ncbi:MAG: ABC transporter permease [Deltaproteobacteria bacterium]|nr:ABC transporter permease [Deltaproteobacteria bacterium]
MLIRLAWRNIWRNRRRTLITVTSIGLGLTCAIFFISMAEGVYVQLVNDAVRLQAGHITLEHPEYRDAPAIDLYLSDTRDIRNQIESMSQVERTKLLILGQGVAKSGLGTVGVAVMGVEPSVEAGTSPLIKNIVSGRYLEDTDGSMVVVGSKLADRLHIKVGKKLVLTTNDVSGALTEDLCRVAGIFETGAAEMDGYLLQAPISFLRKLYGFPPNGATQVGVVLKNPGAQKKTLKRIKSMTHDNPFSAYPWQEIMPELASYIKLDKGSNLVLQAILLFLILFTIFNTILMSVLERSKEFAVLKALGTQPYQMRAQLLLESAFLGLIGCLIGLLVGGLASYALQVWGLDITKLYSDEVSISGFAVSPVIHAKIEASMLLWLIGIVIGATLVISLIPMRRATNVHVADTLR